MLEAATAMAKMTLMTTIIGLPLVILAVYVKVKCKADTFEKLKLFYGFLVLIFVFYLSFKR
jgi:hypothetical protein